MLSFIHDPLQGVFGDRSEPRNPINKDKETMAVLEHAMMHQMEHEGA